jgi:flagellar motor switch protein FliN
MAAEKNMNGEDQMKPEGNGIPQPGDEFDAVAAADRVAKEVSGSSDEDDLEMQMAAAMNMDGGGETDDDLERQLAAALGNGASGRRDDIIDALSDNGEDLEVPIQPVKFPQLRPSDDRVSQDDIDRLLDVSLMVCVELGRRHMLIKDILELGPGKIVELEKLAGEPVDILVNGKILARGEVVVVDENFGVRITDLVDPKDRIRML